MSCYEGEQGSIIIPSAQWAKFKKAVRNAWNTWQDENYKEAMKMWEAVSRDESDETAHYKYQAVRAQARNARSFRMYVEDNLNWCRIEELMFGARRTHFHKPRKTWFPKVTNRTKRLRYDDWVIVFNDNSREVRWFVDWNNHAIERSRAHPAPCKMFYMLNHTKWTGKSGGTITSDNEYNRDAYGTPTEERYGKSAQRAYLMHR